VSASESAPERSIAHARASVSGSVSVYAAGRAATVLSPGFLPAARLFQPSHVALLRWLSSPRHRNGSTSSFHVPRLSPAMRTPGAVPVVTSTSSSYAASGR
jgi:hypothetical protein